MPLPIRTSRPLSIDSKALRRVKKIAIAALLTPIAIGMLNAPPISAQSPATPAPKFEVATVKSCKEAPGQRLGGGEATPGRLTIGCIPLIGENNLGLIQRAYVRFAGGRANPIGVIPIKGGPGWARSEFYEINAKAEGTPSREWMQGPMLQALLEERFRLKLHREIIEGPVYELTIAKDTSRLKPFADGSCVPMPTTIPVPPAPAGQRYCKKMIVLRSPTAVDAEGSTPGEFSKLLNMALDRPIIDKTGIQTRYNFHLEFSADGSTPDLPPAPPDSPAPAIFTAIQEQLGLKLTAAKGPIEVIVIDHVERPSAN